jgi:DNA-binding PadR family transcriptional regulator
MTPYEFEVLLWYYTRTVDFPDMETNPPIWKPTFDKFISEKLIEYESQTTIDSCYRITERGKVWLEHVLNTPLPVQQWVMP